MNRYATTIHSTDDPPPRKLAVKAQFAVRDAIPDGAVISILRDNAARDIAQKIIDESKFFEVKIDKMFGVLRADVIVLTEQEYVDLMRNQFRKGVDYAHGFMPTSYEGR